MGRNKITSCKLTCADDIPRTLNESVKSTQDHGNLPAIMGSGSLLFFTIGDRLLNLPKEHCTTPLVRNIAQLKLNCSQFGFTVS